MFAWITMKNLLFVICVSSFNEIKMMKLSFEYKYKQQNFRLFIRLVSRLFSL